MSGEGYTQFTAANTNGGGGGASNNQQQNAASSIMSSQIPTTPVKAHMTTSNLVNGISINSPTVNGGMMSPNSVCSTLLSSPAAASAFGQRGGVSLHNSPSTVASHPNGPSIAVSRLKLPPGIAFQTVSQNDQISPQSSQPQNTPQTPVATQSALARLQQSQQSPNASLSLTLSPRNSPVSQGAGQQAANAVTVRSKPPASSLDRLRSMGILSSSGSASPSTAKEGGGGTLGSGSNATGNNAVTMSATTPGEESSLSPLKKTSSFGNTNISGDTTVQNNNTNTSKTILTSNNVSTTKTASVSQAQSNDVSTSGVRSTSSVSSTGSASSTKITSSSSNKNSGGRSSAGTNTAGNAASSTDTYEDGVKRYRPLVKQINNGDLQGFDLSKVKKEPGSEDSSCPPLLGPPLSDPFASDITTDGSERTSSGDLLLSSSATGCVDSLFQDQVSTSTYPSPQQSSSSSGGGLVKSGSGSSSNSSGASMSKSAKLALLKKFPHLECRTICVFCTDEVANREDLVVYLLACLHSSCSPCFESQVESSRRNESSSKIDCLDIDEDGGEKSSDNDKNNQSEVYIQCPLCETRTSNLELIVNNFLVNSSSTSSSSSNTIICKSCKNNLPVVNWCNSCEESLCRECVNVHSNFAFFSSHKLTSLPTSQSPSSNGDDNLSFFPVTIPCSKHQSFNLDYFCEACDTLVCRECLTSNDPSESHKGHKYNYATEIAKTQIKSQITHSLSDLKLKQSSLLESRSMLESKLGESKIKECSLMSQVNQLKQSVIDKVSARFDQLSEDILKLAKNHRESMEARKATLDRFHIQNVLTLDFIDNAMRSSIFDVSLVHARRLIEKQLRRATKTDVTSGLSSDGRQHFKIEMYFQTLKGTDVQLGMQSVVKQVLSDLTVSDEPPPEPTPPPPPPPPREPTPPPQPTIPTPMHLTTRPSPSNTPSSMRGGPPNQQPQSRLSLPSKLQVARQSPASGRGGVAPNRGGGSNRGGPSPAAANRGGARGGGGSAGRGGGGRGASAVNRGASSRGRGAAATAPVRGRGGASSSNGRGSAGGRGGQNTASSSAGSRGGASANGRGAATANGRGAATAVRGGRGAVRGGPAMAPARLPSPQQLELARQQQLQGGRGVSVSKLNNGSYVSAVYPQGSQGGPMSTSNPGGPPGSHSTWHTPQSSPVIQQQQQRVLQAGVVSSMNNGVSTANNPQQSNEMGNNNFRINLSSPSLIQQAIMARQGSANTVAVGQSDPHLKRKIPSQVQITTTPSQQQQQQQSGGHQPSPPVKMFRGGGGGVVTTSSSQSKSVAYSQQLPQQQVIVANSQQHLQMVQQRMQGAGSVGGNLLQAQHNTQMQQQQQHFQQAVQHHHPTPSTNTAGNGLLVQQVHSQQQQQQQQQLNNNHMSHAAPIANPPRVGGVAAATTAATATTSISLEQPAHVESLVFNPPQECLPLESTKTASSTYPSQPRDITSSKRATTAATQFSKVLSVDNTTGNASQVAFKTKSEGVSDDMCVSKFKIKVSHPSILSASPAIHGSNFEPNKSPVVRGRNENGVNEPSAAVVPIETTATIVDLEDSPSFDGFSTVDSPFGVTDEEERRAAVDTNSDEGVPEEAESQKVRKKKKSEKRKRRSTAAAVVADEEEEDEYTQPQYPHPSSEDYLWCAVCHDGGDLVCCSECPKLYHANCYIPPLNSNTLEDTWVCDLCTSASKILRLSNDIPNEINLSLGERDFKILRRLLLEIYNQYPLSTQFRDLVDLQFKEYLKKIEKPIALDVICKRLTARGDYAPKQYTNVSCALKDIRLMFNNCLKFHASKKNVYYVNAKKLLAQFEDQLEIWLPNMTYDDSPYDNVNAGDDYAEPGDEEEAPLEPQMSRCVTTSGRRSASRNKNSKNSSGVCKRSTKKRGRGKKTEKISNFIVEDDINDNVKDVDDCEETSDAEDFIEYMETDEGGEGSEEPVPGPSKNSSENVNVVRRSQRRRTVPFLMEDVSDDDE